MRILLDTHALIWMQDNPVKLGTLADPLLRNPANELVVSMASIWELGIKIAIGKLKLVPPYRHWIETAISSLNLTVLPITLDHAERQISLPFHHRDPFDRMLVAQSLFEGISLASADTIFDTYGVARIWN